jgi:hypothetical protein
MASSLRPGPARWTQIASYLPNRSENDVKVSPRHRSTHACRCYTDLSADACLGCARPARKPRLCLSYYCSLLMSKKRPRLPPLHRPMPAEHLVRAAPWCYSGCNTRVRLLLQRVDRQNDSDGCLDQHALPCQLRLAGRSQLGTAQPVSLTPPVVLYLNQALDASLQERVQAHLPAHVRHCGPRQRLRLSRAEVMFRQSREFKQAHGMWASHSYELLALCTRVAGAGWSGASRVHDADGGRSGRQLSCSGYSPLQPLRYRPTEFDPRVTLFY